jgi:hypothetical protein
MACGGTCGCDDCDADRRVLGPCVAAMACLSPDGSVGTVPIHPSGASKSRERARSSRSAPRLPSPRVAGDVRGAVTPPSHEPSIERSPYAWEAQHGLARSGPPRGEFLESPAADDALSEYPEGSASSQALTAAPPSAGGDGPRTGERPLSLARATGPSLELLPPGQRGKGGGGGAGGGPGAGAGTPPGGQPPGGLGAAAVPAPGEDPDCAPCNCVCGPPTPARPPGPPNTPPAPDEPNDPEPESQPSVLALRLPDGADAAVAQPGRVLLPPQFEPFPQPPAASPRPWDLPPEARSGVEPIEDHGDMTVELELLGLDGPIDDPSISREVLRPAGTSGQRFPALVSPPGQVVAGAISPPDLPPTFLRGARQR